MEKLNYVDTVPEYITKFIETNIDNIQKIITDEKKNRGDGMIYIDTDIKENKLNLVFLTYQESLNTLDLTEEFLNKTNVEGKTIIIINDNEYKTRFIIYI
tara:strand:- start:340 stop:639 length:300 start_codon:yes stop_codon:yes gene_type:complete